MANLFEAFFRGPRVRMKMRTFVYVVVVVGRKEDYPLIQLEDNTIFSHMFVF